MSIQYACSINDFTHFKCLYMIGNDSQFISKYKMIVH